MSGKTVLNESYLIVDVRNCDFVKLNMQELLFSGLIRYIGVSATTNLVSFTAISGGTVKTFGK